MPFLLPALAALASDCLILYLGHAYGRAIRIDDDDETIHTKYEFIYKTSYVVPLAMIRIILLCFPLPYHSYTGTALKGKLLYQIFYFGTLALCALHMLSMIMLDPTSLSSLVSGGGSAGNADDDASRAFRRWLLEQSSLVIVRHRHVWTNLALTLWSDLMHLILFYHVHSSAPEGWKRRYILYNLTHMTPLSRVSSERSLFANRGDVEAPLTQSSINSPIFQNASSGIGSELLQQMRCLPGGQEGFIVELQTRFQQTKQTWAQRLEAFRHRAASSGSGAAVHNGPHFYYGPSKTTQAFRVLLQLFAYEQNVFEEMDRVFGATGTEMNPEAAEALTFYVPQLLTFLIHGAYDNATTLERWVLAKCKKNAFFAHRCYWFLRAWCLEGSHPIASAPPTITTSAANSLDLPMTPHTMTNNDSVSCSSQTMTTTPASPNRRYSMGGQTVIEGLLQRVMECGQLSSNQLEFGNENESTGQTTSQLGDEAITNSQWTMAQVMNAVEEGKLPVDKNTGRPSAAHLDTLTANHRFGFLPLYRKENLNGGDNDLFLSTPRFLDTLLSLADGLMRVPREERTKQLRNQLERIELEYLPSNSIYMPLSNVNHRVWRIVAEESIAMSTKERVPCIICLEVLDYDSPQAKTQQLPQQNQSQSQSQSGLGILELIRKESTDFATGSNSRIGQSTLSLGSKSGSDEREVIWKWKSSLRNPRRHVTLLDNITSFTQDTIRSTQETVRRLTQENRGAFERLNSIPAEREEEEESTDRSFSPIPSNPTARLGSQNDASIGQWASPSSPFKKHTERRNRYEHPKIVQKVARDDSVIGDKSGLDPDLMGALLDIRQKNEQAAITAPSCESSPTAASVTSFDGRETGIESVYGSTKRATVRPPTVVFKESWESKEDRIRKKSSYGSDPNWRLFPILIKSNDDLRQEQLASQIIYRMASILAHEKIPVWLCPYEILALTDRGGIIEAIPDTISLDSLKRNDLHYNGLAQFFREHFEGNDYLDAKANFVESLAAYSIVCFLLQIKDRHNGNILLDNKGHLIHIDFGFLFLSSPGKNSGFESAPFKLTREFVEVLDGPDSPTFRTFRDLCCRTFLTLRKHCYEITLLVEMLTNGNEGLNCFRGRPDDAVRDLRERFRLDLNDRACIDYVNALVDESLENWRTRWYDRYQRFCVGVL